MRKLKQYFENKFWGFLTLMIFIFFLSIYFSLMYVGEIDGNKSVGKIGALPIYYFFFPTLLWDFPQQIPPKLRDDIYKILMIVNPILNITLAALLINYIYNRIKKNKN